MASRKRPRQERSKATVAAIVEATGQVFGEHGYRRTTTTQVAACAGVSVGSLYQYFPDKRALVAAFFERRLEQDVELMQNVAARARLGSAIEVVRVTTEEMVELYRRDRELYQSVVDILPWMEQTREVQDGLARAHEAAVTMLRAHPELLGGRDAELVALVALQSVRGSLFRIVQMAPEKLDDPDLPRILVGGVLGFLGLPADAR
jgi:AcrR family transcriptional regulator